MIGPERTLRYRMPSEGDDAPRPEAGDFLVVTTTGTTYRVTRAHLVRDSVEPWRDPAPPSYLDGITMRVLHFRLRAHRIDPDERPDDAMTWPMVWDRRCRA